jgi:hypothetical protein
VDRILTRRHLASSVIPFCSEKENSRYSSIYVENVVEAFDSSFSTPIYGNLRPCHYPCFSSHVPLDVSFANNL